MSYVNSSKKIQVISIKPTNKNVTYAILFKIFQEKCIWSIYWEKINLYRHLLGAATEICSITHVDDKKLVYTSLKIWNLIIFWDIQPNWKITV